LKTERRHVTLIMNGNAPPKPVTENSSTENSVLAQGQSADVFPGFMTRVRNVFRHEGWGGLVSRIIRRSKVVYLIGKDVISRIFSILMKIPYVFINEGWLGVRQRITGRLGQCCERLGLMKWMPESVWAMQNRLEFWMAEAQRNPDHKLLIISDYGREELVQAYMAADLFVFASNIEYSPLVLFEAAAAGTAFLSVPVGNAEEIARWTRGGMLCPADKDERGYTRVDPKVMAKEIAKAIENPAKLIEMGKQGRNAWKGQYTWSAITTRYEAILTGIH